MSAEKSLALPKASVKRIMKLSDEVQNVSAEAVIAVSKVTEDFLNQIVAQAHEVSQAHNRKTIKVRSYQVIFGSFGLSETSKCFNHRLLSCRYLVTISFLRTMMQLNFLCDCHRTISRYFRDHVRG